METYTFLRQLADSWVLLAMTLFFISMVLWTLRPSAKAIHKDTSLIPMRNEDAPMKARPGDHPDNDRGDAAKFEVGQ